MKIQILSTVFPFIPFSCEEFTPNLQNITNIVEFDSKDFFFFASLISLSSFLHFIP